MRFITFSVTKCKARLGTLCEFEKMANLTLETPLLTLYTRRGSVPHLTKDVLKLVSSEQHMLCVSLPHSVTMAESIKEFDSFQEFVGMQEYPIFLTIQDPAEKTDPCNQKQNFVSVWTKQGRIKLAPKDYMDLVESYKPDAFLALCDGDTDLDSSNKRISHAVEKSNAVIDKCLQRQETSENLKTVPMFGAIEGGYSLPARQNSIKHLIDKPLFGYVIDGLHKNGPEIANINLLTMIPVLKHTLNLLPVEKPKAMMGCYCPPTVLDLVELGIDIFDSSYSYVMTEQAKALVFLCDNCSDDPKDMLDMTDKRYADDFAPICKSCTCLTCTNHTRAYINHLFLTKELLGLVLLMIHNTHTYIQFFKTIRDHIKNETLHEFHENITSKFTMEKVEM